VARCLERSAGRAPICFLSGGWDSRAIVACLARLVSGAAFDTFTTSYDGGNDREERFAEKVAAALGLRHHVLALDEGYYPRHAEAALLASDYATDMHVWMSDLLSKVATHRELVNFDGYAGDLLFRGLLQQPDDDARSATDPSFFDRFSVVAPGTVLSSPVARTFERLARDELARELECHQGARRTFRFLLHNRAWRGVAHSVRLQKRAIDVELPFLDSELMRYALSIDDSVRLSPAFYPAVLAALDQRLSGLPSTNDKPLSAGWSPRPIEKYSEATVDWFLSNIRSGGAVPADSGGVIDWFSVEPTRRINQTNDPTQRNRRFRALEMLDLYALWLRRYQGNVELGHVLDYAQQEGGELRSTTRPTDNQPEYAAIARKYVERARAAEGASLRFHLTVDVEAFPVTDEYAYHTAAPDPIRALIYSDFGAGSDLEHFLLRERVPSTYFLEAYSSAWPTDSAVADAARFFKRDFTELGLHCHAFSLPRPRLEALGLEQGWFLQPQQLAACLRDGKSRLQAATGDVISTYRSGRLDFYPQLDSAAAEAGFRIDSSLADGHSINYYTELAQPIGNDVHVRNGIIEVPVTAYRVRERSRVLDFNGSSFEEMCFVIVRALELGLPNVTMLMHSWSLSDVQELPLLAKGFHHKRSSAACQKLQHLLDFLDDLECVELSTIQSTVEQRSNMGEQARFGSADFELEPPPLQLLIQHEADLVTARVILNAQPFSGAPEYAFYLVVRGERIATRWYEQRANATFSLPAGTAPSTVEVVAFVRDNQNPGKPIVKSVALS
jgi:hypothetical protein